MIDQLNERFGTEFTQADQLFFDQIVETATRDPTLQTAAAANTLGNFEQVLARMVEGLMIDRLDGNEAIFDRYANDRPFREQVLPYLAREVYGAIRRGIDTPDGGSK